MSKVKFTDSNGQDQVEEMVVLGGTITAGGSAAGLVVVDGLANNATRMSAETIATLTLGFRVLLKGNGTIVFTPNDGTEEITLTTTEINEMPSGTDVPLACSSLQVTGTTQLLVYIP